MRVTGGSLKGRKLVPLRGMKIRPTTDYLREAIFNILVGMVEEAVVLDLFAGTGSLGIEAISRGAETGVFVDKAPQAIHVLNRNVRALALEEKSRILKRDISRGLGFLKAMDLVYTLVFVDPPYDRGFAEACVGMLGRSPAISDEAVIVVEHSNREILPEKITRLELNDRRGYGKTLVSFYRPVVLA